MKAVRNIAVLTGSAATLFALQQITFHVNKVQDDDMNPLMQKGDVVLSFKGINHEELKDKACLVYEPITSQYQFKRVIGIPNEWIKDNGSKLIISVPNGCLYLESDKESAIKQEIEDSTDYTIPSSPPRANPYDNLFYSSLVVGIPLFRVYPFDRFGYIINQ